MNRINALRMVFLISFFLATACHAYTESYNEDSCFKDYVKEENKDVVVAVNRDTNVIELYWSDKDQTWIKPDEKYQQELQQLYKRKLQQRRIQQRLDQMREDTMYTTNQRTIQGQR